MKDPTPLSDFTSETWGFPLKFEIEDSHLDLKNLVFSNAEIRSLFPLCQFKHFKSRLFGRLFWFGLQFCSLSCKHKVPQPNELRLRHFSLTQNVGAMYGMRTRGKDSAR